MTCPRLRKRRGPAGDLIDTTGFGLLTDMAMGLASLATHHLGQYDGSGGMVEMIDGFSPGWEWRHFTWLLSKSAAKCGSVDGGARPCQWLVSKSGAEGVLADGRSHRHLYICVQIGIMRRTIEMMIDECRVFRQCDVLYEWTSHGRCPAP